MNHLTVTNLEEKKLSSVDGSVRADEIAVTFKPG